MFLQGSLSIERMCQLVPVSRRSYFRSLKEQQPADEELEVRLLRWELTLRSNDAHYSQPNISGPEPFPVRRRVSPSG
jgi:hypothetical protein